MGFNLNVPSPKSGGNGDFETAPAGNHRAVCVGVLNLGTLRRDFKGEVDEKPMVALVFELVDEHDSTGWPFVVIREYTMSLHESANLRKDLEKWSGRKFEADEVFDLSKVLGKSCLVEIKHETSANENVFAKWVGLSSLPKGMAASGSRRKPFTWDHAEDAMTEIPGWVPYLYGQTVTDYIAARRVAPKANGKAATNGHGKSKPARNEDAEDEVPPAPVQVYETADAAPF